MWRAATAAIASALVLAGAAQAEMPDNHGAPELTGRAAVGWGLVGHNGSWLYRDGSACGPECIYSFAWERCRPAGCARIAGATGRVYKVRGVDVGARLRVVVATTKYDCGEWNYAAGTQECRWVMREAVSPESDVVPKPVTKSKAKAKPRKPKPKKRTPTPRG
jgi:hypothetical protein